MFVHKAWYAAVRSDELRDKPFARTFLEQPVVLYRTRNGTPVALEDRCPHRFLPLSMGCVIGDQIRCGYHGLVYDPSGKCVSVPTQASVPKSAVVRAYPLIEKFGFIWIWMGNPAAADAKLLPQFGLDVNLEHHVSDGWSPAHGYYCPKANYLLVVDNLLDLSHITYVHAGSLSAGGFDQAEVHVKVEASHVRDLRVARDIAAGPAYASMVGGEDVRIDYWLDMHWQSPCNLLLDVAMPKAGQPKHSGVRFLSSQLVTPETRVSSHYYWVSSRNFFLGDDEYTRGWQKIVADAFDQDAAVLSAQQARIGDNDLLDLKPVLLKSDQASVQARRIVKRMLQAETLVGQSA